MWIVNASTGSTLLGPMQYEDNAIISLAFSSDGNKFVALSNQSSIRVFLASTGELLHALVYESFDSPKHTPSPNTPQTAPISDSLPGPPGTPSQTSDRTPLSSHSPCVSRESLSLKPPIWGDSKTFVALRKSEIIAGLPDRSIRIWHLTSPEQTGPGSTSEALIPVNIGRTVVIIPEHFQDYRLCMIEKEVVVFSIFLRQFFVIDLSPYF